MSRVTLSLVVIVFLLVACWQVGPLLASGESEEMVNNWGINFPWLNNHDGTESANCFGEDYDAKKVEDDLAGIQALGLTRVRVFASLEGIMEYDGTAFFWNSQAKTNLNDFLERCDAHGIGVIMVISAGKHDGQYESLDGKFRWDLAKTQEGIDQYLRAQTAYINEYKVHDNIIMFELFNEPYSEMTWSPGATISGITKDEMYNFLKQSYDNAKTLTDIYVGISEYEEQEQGAKYQTFSNVSNREKYIDPCTDVYSMHIYRPDGSYLLDFSKLTSKPKWLSEIGNLNYFDPYMVGHPMAGCNELYDEEKNFDAVVSISEKAFESGFSCIYLWSWGSNNGMVIHNPDGSHNIGKLLRWVQEQILT